MKKQVVIIHGGDSYNTYKKYLSDLKSEKVDIERYFARRWKNELPRQLGKSFEIIAPRMPNAENARYLEWKLWFEKFIPFMRNGVILIGTSMGGAFLAKYLSENKFSKKIGATLFVSAPYFSGGMHYKDYETPKDWILPKSLSKIEKQGGKIFFYQNTDDELVPFRDLKRYAKVLPTATRRVFKGRGHSFGAKFPEIVRDIKEVLKK